jgi:hypothetical protein
MTWNSVKVARGLFVVLACAACLAGPMERSNYWDEASGSSIEISGVPDTIYSVLDTFELAVSSIPAFPGSAGGATMTFVSGRALLTELGGFRFVPTGITVIPQPVTFAAHVNPVRAWPVDTLTLWMVQRPQTLVLSCFSVGCQSVAVAASTVAQVTGTDEGGGVLAIPVSFPPFGAAVSSDTLIMRIIGRSGPRISIVGVAPGVANLQFSAGGVVATPIPITVTP